MNRRTLLAVGGTVALGGIAGCLGGGSDADGYGPEPENEPDDRSIDTSSYPTQTFDGVAVPLAPIEDVFYWYQRQEARIADARGSDQYEQAHIAGAPLSPAPDGGSNDPVAEWATDERIVTYCGCPHHLSGLRAASLIDAGYEDVYALDDGFQAWIDAGYPLEGSAVSEDRATYSIQGQSTAAPGEMVMLEQVDADRLEAAPIADDGSYTLQLHYAGSTDSRFRVEAPDYTVEGTLTELTSTTVTP